MFIVRGAKAFFRAGIHIFTPVFRLHTVTTGSGDRLFGYFVRLFHVLIEIYPLVPFPLSVRVGVSVYTSDPVRRTPQTRADAITTVLWGCVLCAFTLCIHVR